MKRKFPPLYLALVFLVLTGCNRGCTISSTLDEVSKTVKVGEYDAVVTIRFIEHRHSKRRDKNIFDRRVTFTYGIAYDIELPFWKDEEVVYTPWRDKDNEPDLDAELERFVLKSSPNGDHFAVGLADVCAGVYSIYAEEVFQGTNYVDAAWSEVNLESLPSPRAMISKALETGDNCTFAMMNNQTLKRILEKAPVDDQHHIDALSAWPDCGEVRDYLTTEKIAQLRQQPKWLEAAKTRLFEALNNSWLISTETETVFLMAEHLKDPQVYEVIDSVMSVNWGTKRPGNQHAYIADRIRSGQLSEKVKGQLQERVDGAFEQFMSDFRTDPNTELQRQVQFYLLMKDQAQVDRFLGVAMTKEAFDGEGFDILEALFGNFDEYQPAEQERIIAGMIALMEDMKDYMRDTVLEDLEPHLECSKIKELVGKYPEDMKHYRMPERCEEAA